MNRVPGGYTAVVAAASDKPRETREVERLLNVSHNLCEHASGIISMLDEMRARLLGEHGEKADGANAAPEPVRSELDELNHRLGAMTGYMEQIRDKVVRLGRI